MTGRCNMYPERGREDGGTTVGDVDVGGSVEIEDLHPSSTLVSTRTSILSVRRSLYVFDEPGNK